MIFFYSMAFLLLQGFSKCFSCIDSSPICVVSTPNSILNRKENYIPAYVCDRQRYGTCTGAAWFHDNHLAVLNLYGKKIIIYKFNPEEKKFDTIQEINNQLGAKLTNSENLTVSPDGSLLALCSDGPCPGLKIYTINPETHMIHPEPIFSLPAKDLVHNVKFASDGKHLAYVTFHNDDSIVIYRVHADRDSLNLQLTCTKKNTLKLMKAKAIGFTKNNKFVVVAYSLPLHDSQKNQLESLLVSYEFDNKNGIVGNPVCSIKQALCIEDLALLHDDSALILSNQDKDVVRIYEFDKYNGQIVDEGYDVLQNPEAQLSFPHGIAVSQDEKYLVVANYGDDKFNLYQIK